MAYIVGGIVAAFCLGLLAHRLGLSPVIGYLLAGIVLGPHTPGFAADSGVARQIADIGVILIMFGLGLKFSPASLLAFRWKPVVGAGLQMLIVTAFGYGLGPRLGFAPRESAIFGFALSIASTVVLLRALEDNRLIDTTAGGVAVCWVLVQDLAAIVALVIMPVLAQTETGESPASAILATLAVTAGQVALFVVLMLVLGRRMLQPLLSFLIKAQLRELFSLGVFAIALGVAFLAHKVFGVSFALGAFLAGLVLNEANLNHKATEDMLPLRDAFAALFFVSVGMLFDPTIFVTHFWLACGVLAAIVIGNAVASFLILRALGISSRESVIITAGLAQVGELSFLLTGFCFALGLLPVQAHALLLGCALIAIAINPFLFRAAIAFAGRLPHEPKATPAASELSADPLRR